MPLGSCLLHWEGPVNGAVRARLPHVVEVTSLYVHGDTRRRGLGSALMAEAECQAKRRTRPAIGVSVGDMNVDARQLYDRLCYSPSGVRFRSEYEYVDESGVTVQAVEEGDFLLTMLRTP